MIMQQRYKKKKMVAFPSWKPLHCFHWRSAQFYSLLVNYFFICLSTLPDMLHCLIFSVPFHFDFGCQPTLCCRPAAVWVISAPLCRSSGHTVSPTPRFEPVFGAVILSPSTCACACDGFNSSQTQPQNGVCRAKCLCSLNWAKSKS